MATKNKKKIFFIMSTNDYSGAEAVNFSIIENLKEKYDFYWVSKKGKINNFLKEANIRWIEIKSLSISEIKRIVKENKPDILHATDFKASVICALANTKVFLIEHLHNNAPWLKKIGINSCAFLYAGLKANKILTVSESIEKEYIFSRYIRNKIECIDNPISRKKILSKVTNLNCEKIYDICCVARLTKQKNPYKFLNILSEIKKEKKDIKAVWVGDGELKDNILRKAIELNLNNNIVFVGFQKNPYIYMASSKIFMLTSNWEGYGLVAFEALTLGLPCVVSNVGGLPNVVDNECGKLCNSEEEFIKEINTLLKNNTIYNEKMKKAKKKAVKIENLNTYIEKINKMYKESQR